MWRLGGMLYHVTVLTLCHKGVLHLVLRLGLKRVDKSKKEAHNSCLRQKLRRPLPSASGTHPRCPCAWSRLSRLRSAVECRLGLALPCAATGPPQVAPRPRQPLFGTTALARSRRHCDCGPLRSRQLAPDCPRMRWTCSHCWGRTGRGAARPGAVSSRHCACSGPNLLPRARITKRMVLAVTPWASSHIKNRSSSCSLICPEELATERIVSAFLRTRTSTRSGCGPTRSWRPSSALCSSRSSGRS
mmetsp:Transcript_28272/g.81194  ORF Transcript_28272/g.81194 Transcript_28272/m.81194 type:complete len:245 (+) Transcript_28272:274-1008(+)